MFNWPFYSLIDAIQDTKKKFVDYTIQHDGLKNCLHEFVDAQTRYTKAAVDNAIATSSKLYSISIDKKFYDVWGDQLLEMIPNAFKTNKAK